MPVLAEPAEWLPMAPVTAPPETLEPEPELSLVPAMAGAEAMARDEVMAIMRAIFLETNILLFPLKEVAVLPIENALMKGTSLTSRQ